MNEADDFDPVTEWTAIDEVERDQFEYMVERTLHAWHLADLARASKWAHNCEWEDYNRQSRDILRDLNSDPRWRSVCREAGKRKSETTRA